MKNTTTAMIDEEMMNVEEEAETALEARKCREIIKSQQDDRRSVDGISIKGVTDNSGSNEFSCRIGYALEVLKKGRGLVKIGVDPEEAFDRALSDTIAMSNRTRSCVPSMITRELGFVGDLALEKVKQLYIDAFNSKKPCLDDLLSILLLGATRKDNPDWIREAYLSV